MVGSLIPLLLISRDSNATPGATSGPPPVIRRADTSQGIGAVEGKPTFDAPPAREIDPAAHDYEAVLQLESGEVRVALLDDYAPEHVNNFVALARQGYFDGLSFYWVEEGAKAQTGDPTATGDGDAGYTLPAEAPPDDVRPLLTLNASGVLAMAQTGRGISGSQFLITLAPQPSLDGQLTAFGRVIEGFELVEDLTPRNPLAQPAPAAGDRLVGVRIQEVEPGVVAQVTGLKVNDIGAVEGKPTFDAPPAMTLDTSKEYTAIMTLETGVVRIRLLDNQAPVHVNNFVFLAEQGFYDGLTFHRVIDGFVAQSGDPTAAGTGGAGYTLPDEDRRGDTVSLSLDRTGVVAMARGPQGASSSQFFITFAPQGFLDAEGFTAFGVVAEGMDAVERLPRRDPDDVPPPPAGGRILSIRIETE